MDAAHYIAELSRMATKVCVDFDGTPAGTKLTDSHGNDWEAVHGTLDNADWVFLDHESEEKTVRMIGNHWLMFKVYDKD
jgi:hypothetical protein